MKIVTIANGTQTIASRSCSTKILLITFFIIQALPAVVPATIAINVNATA